VLQRNRRHGGLLMVAVLAATASLCACAQSPAGPPPRLLVLSAERQAALARALGPRAPVAEAPADASPPAPEASSALTSQAEVDALVTACRATHGVAGGAPDGAGEGGLTAGYGQVYRGTRDLALPPLPADGIFRWVEGDPEFLDPNRISEASGTALASQMFEPLLVPAPGNTPPVPGQAERYTVSPDGLTYTFTLRPDLVWSDGTPLTADTFRRSWLRGLDPETASSNAEQLWVIAGAEAYNTRATTDPDTVAIRALDPLTLEVRLTAPTPYFPDLVTYIAYAPVPLHAIAAHGAAWTRPEHLVVNGPFRMTEWRPRERIVMAKNPRYWDAAHVALAGTQVQLSDSESKNVLLYETGQAHWVNPLPTDAIRTFVAEGRADLHIDAQMCTYYYVFNLRRPPFDDARVRRAFDQALDKDALTRHVLAAFQLPATSLLPDMYRGTLGYAATGGPPHDLAAARALLVDAGYPQGRGLPPVTILYNTSEAHRQIAEYVAEDLRAGLGAAVTAQNLEWKTLLKRVQTGDFEIARTSWCADYPDPLTFLNVYHSDSQNNYPAYTSPPFDALLARLRQEPDRAERNALLCAAERLLAQDAPLLPVYIYTRAYLLRPEVRGFAPQYANRHYLKWVSLAPPPSGGP